MRIARSTGAIAGALIVLLGIWAALIPFIGPYFHYSFAPNEAWHYTADRLWLDVLPGLAAMLAGIWMLLASRRVSGLLAGTLALLAGAWLIVGPAVSLTWEPAHGPIGAPLYGSTRQTLELVGYFYGLGALIAAIAAIAIGRFSARPALSAEAAIARAARTEPLTKAPAVPAAPNARSRRRLGLWRRDKGRRAGVASPIGARGD
jgi:hypothetical protein